MLHAFLQGFAHIASATFRVGIAVNSDVVTKLSAEQLPDGYSPGLAGQIPASYLNCTDATGLTGVTTELSTTGGTSDGRFIADICPQVIEIGPVNATIHKIDECVEIAALQQLSSIYRHILDQLLT